MEIGHETSSGEEVKMIMDSKVFFFLRTAKRGKAADEIARRRLRLPACRGGKDGSNGRTQISMEMCEKGSQRGY